MATKPTIPKGTRDFGPVEMLRRKYIFSTIEKVFQKYGYLPLETPAMENLETLTGKYGEEGDRLIFKILKRGADLERAVQDGSKSLAGEALRYDLTVPFARYVVQNQNEIAFPFKRYQIQPVWRADRPQKGRYREFYQCDADVIGSTSLLNEVELVQVIHDVFQLLDLKVKLLVNNRKVLTGMAQLFGVADRLVDFITTLDKFDKVGSVGVLQEYAAKDYPSTFLTDMESLLKFAVDPDGVELSHELYKRFETSGIEEGIVGFKQTHIVINQGAKEAFGSNEWPEHFSVRHDLTLARGLDYYTGAIFEVKAAEGTLQSSICGGGRYDDLTGVFGLKGMSGVGISFGADRIFDVLLETNKFPAALGSSTQLLFANFGEKEAMHCLKLLRQVREAEIASELYPDSVKLPKQFTYAEKKGIPYVAIVGETEMKEGLVTLKKMGAGEKGEMMTIEELIQRLSKQP